MELRHLRVFVALSNELHFGRAATKLRIAQSAVSQTLMDLEAELGVELFARTKRSVALTSSGRQFVDYARGALAQVEQGALAARSAARGEDGELRLSFTLMSTLTPLPRVVAQFQSRYPRVRLNISQGGSVEQLEAIRQGRCDIGFMAFKREIAPLASEVVSRNALVAVLPAHHGLARRRRLELGALAKEPFVFLKQRSEPEVYTRFLGQCARAGFEPNVILEVDQLEALLSFVAAGLGVSCTPNLIERLRFPGIKTVPLSPEIRGGISAVWRPERLPATATRFLEVMRSELR